MTTRSETRSRQKTAEAAEGEANEKKAEKPQRLLHMLLLYPALAIAVLTAVPEWATKGYEIYTGLTKTDTTLAEALRRNKLFERNIECLGAPQEFKQTQRVSIDATICPSGDLLIRAMRLDGSGFASSDLKTDFIDITTMLNRKEASLFDAFKMTATAAPAPQGLPAATMPTSPVVKAQSFVLVVCTKKTDSRHLLRHVKVDGTCYDEVIDTYTGNLASRNQVPCRPNCG